MFTRIFVVAIAFIATSGFAPLQDDPECDDAVDAYNSAVDEISTRSRRYTVCVAGSRGTDDCSAEFRRLRSAQSDFESAVADFRSYCR